MTLSILVATVGRRNQQFLDLMEDLTKQAERWPIEIIAYWNNGELPISEIRQQLLEEATTDYVCFVDDDDTVPVYYCDEIMWALGKDYVGFEVQLFEKDRLMPRVFHSIKYGVWHDDDYGYYRGVTHLNPIKREIALKAKFTGDEAGEDEDWARMVTPYVRSENYIDKIMYYYRHDADETLFGGAHKKRQTYERPDFRHPQFKWHPKSQVIGRM